MASRESGGACRGLGYCCHASSTLERVSYLAYMFSTKRLPARLVDEMGQRRRGREEEIVVSTGLGHEIRKEKTVNLKDGCSGDVGLLYLLQSQVWI